MRSRLRAAASAISAERMSPCAFTRSDCACSRSLSAPPRIASSSRCRFSICCASASRDRALSTPATAVTRSFWPCTNSLASIANSGAPRSTWSPGRAISRLTRPEYGEKTGVVVSSLIAILPSVARSSRNATWRTGASLQARPLRLARTERAVGIARHLVRSRHGVARAAVGHPHAGDRCRRQPARRCPPATGGCAGDADAEQEEPGWS